MRALAPLKREINVSVLPQQRGEATAFSIRSERWFGGGRRGSEQLLEPKRIVGTFRSLTGEEDGWDERTEGGSEGGGGRGR